MIKRILIFIVVVTLFCLVGIILAEAGDCTKMQAIAQRCANTMARNGYMAHCPMTGQHAENVAYGYRTKAAVMAGWWQSPGHAANMRLPGCKATASAVGRNGVHYWAMEIGW